MKFYISRTSGKHPCPEAVQEENGKWSITLDTLEQLLGFIDTYGDVIVWDTTHSIEIYDDYRE